MVATVPPSALHAAPVTYGPVGQQEDDDRGDLGGLGEPAERPPGRDLREHGITVALLLREPAGSEPGVGCRRPGRDDVAADAVGSVDVGDEPREREERRLHHRVVRHRRRRALARARRDVHDRASPPHVRKRCARRAHGAHQVQLERPLPVVIGQLVEAADLRPAHVVDEAVEAAEALDRRADDVLGTAGAREVGGDVDVPRPLVAPAGRDHEGAFSAQLERHLTSDAGGRAGHDTHLVLEAQLHGAATLAG
jgi:hypothetical protein